MNARGSPAPPKRVGRYMLGAVIASGGMATVHFGKLFGPVGFRPAVAIKRLHPWLAKEPHFAAMIMDEARLAGRVRHPNVVPTLDVIAEDGELYLVMEYVHGESLSRLARKAATGGERIPQAISVGIMHGVLLGLHAAHEATSEKGKPLGIVHRDVSPQNIIVGVDGIARMLDFGVARAAGQVHTTGEGDIKGKVAYMAPEQLADGHIDRRVDVYAVGIVLWELLAGERLFVGDSETALLACALAGVREAPSARAPQVAPGLDDVVMRALRPEASMRFPTAREMALALERCVPAASPLEVGAWVESTARDAIAERAAALATIEASARADNALDQGEASAREPEAPSGEPTPRALSRRTAALAAAFLGCGVVAVLAARSQISRAGGSATSAPAESSAPRPAAAESAPVPSSDPGLVPSAAGSSPASHVRAIVPHHPRKTGVTCDPPYWYDSAGIKRYKVECEHR